MTDLAHETLTPDPAEAERFLKIIGGTATRFTFQTFDDREDRKKAGQTDKSLTRVLHGTLAEHLDLLTRLNLSGAGIYITINETDFQGRSKANIVKVRALFVDGDDVAKPTLASEWEYKPPHVIVETSSPRCWHAYWLVEDVTLEQFESKQRALIERYATDATVHDLSRVMRLPGFYHMKRQPVMVRIVAVNDGPLYQAIAFRTARVEPRHSSNGDPTCDLETVRALLEVIPNPGDVLSNDVSWDLFNRVGMATWRATGGVYAGLALFNQWCQKAPRKNNRRNTVRKWDGYATSPPTEIGAGTLFYLADQADPTWRHRHDNEIEAKIRAANERAMGDDDPMLAKLMTRAGERAADPPNKSESPPNASERKPEQPQPEQPRQEQPSGAQSAKRRLLFSSAEFVAGFTPPDYLIDGLLQRKNVYSLTGRTGDGKTAVAIRIAAHVAMGLPICGCPVEKGRVVYFAGENPDDVRSRWIKQCEDMRIDPTELEVFFLAGTPPIFADEVKAHIAADVKAIGAISLLVVDTSAAYYTGSDENDNVQLGNHARNLRAMVTLPGNPTILTTCHPTKNPDMSNLLPRGGGAFLAEVDGNLVAIRERGSPLVEITTHGKFRGAEFDPLSFKLMELTSEKLKTSRGKNMWTVIAVPIAEGERSAMADAGYAKRSQLLMAMIDRPASSIAELAQAVGWTYRNGDPNRSLVQRLLASLCGEKLVEKKGDRWVPTPKGRKAARPEGAAGGPYDDEVPM